jgi:AraC family transcriptional regulator
MDALGTTAVFGRVKPLEQASFRPQMEDFQSAARDSSTSCLGFGYLANSLTQLLETARREFDRDREVARASLAGASALLQTEIERYSSANGSVRAGLAPWQMVRVRSFIDSNLHRTIHIRDLSAVAQRSPAHFSRKFKLAVGESPHTYVMRRRLERACHLMMTSTSSLCEIALSVGFSDQAHLCRLFRAAFGQSPASWRREHGNLRRDAVANTKRWSLEGTFRPSGTD